MTRRLRLWSLGSGGGSGSPKRSHCVSKRSPSAMGSRGFVEPICCLRISLRTSGCRSDKTDLFAQSHATKNQQLINRIADCSRVVLFRQQCYRAGAVAEGRLEGPLDLDGRRSPPQEFLSICPENGEYS